MKKMTTFFTIVLLVCIATFVAFASNQNRDVSDSYLVVDVNDDFPGKYSDEDNTGTDSEGPLYSTASSWSGYYLNDNGDLKFSACGYGYVSCSTNNENYKTTYSLHAKVHPNLAFVNERKPEAETVKSHFYKSVYVSGDGNGAGFSLGGSFLQYYCLSCGCLLLGYHPGYCC